MGVQLVLTHENTDFDGLASQLAVWKLHPQARPVLPRRPNRNLRDFLTLYWDELPYVRYEDLSRRMEVDRIFLVDTQTLVTPKGMSEGTVVQIIDHHPLSRDLPPQWTYMGEEVGATVTLLLEQIIADGFSLTPVEATLLTPRSWPSVAIEHVYAGDRISDLLSHASPQTLVLTGLSGPQLVRAAELMDVPAICVLNGGAPDRAAVEAAREKGIALLATPLAMFEACGRLYERLARVRASGR